MGFSKIIIMAFDPVAFDRLYTDWRTDQDRIDWILYHQVYLWSGVLHAVYGEDYVDAANLYGEMIYLQDDATQKLSGLLTMLSQISPTILTDEQIFKAFMNVALAATPISS